MFSEEEIAKNIRELQKLPLNYQEEVMKVVVDTFTMSIEKAKVDYVHEINKKICEIQGHDFGGSIHDDGWSYCIRRLHPEMKANSVIQKLWSRKCDRCGYIETKCTEIVPTPVKYLGKKK